MSFDVFTGLLKMFDDFVDNSSDIHLSYDLSDKNLKDLKFKYNLNDKIGKVNNFEKAVNLLHWVSTDVYYDGNSSPGRKNNSMELLDYSYRKGKDYGINCRCHAIILTECLLAIGIPARTIYIMPFSPYDQDNHVITHAFISEKNKWIMLDPSFDCYVKNKKGEILNIFEIRELLSNQEYIDFNDEIHCNEEKWENDAPFHKEYLAKDLFWFMTSDVSRYNAEDGENHVVIGPKNYDIKKAQIENVEFRIKKHGEEEWLHNWLERAKKTEYKYTTTKELLKKPEV
jgi:hypothetical protein